MNSHFNLEKEKADVRDEDHVFGATDGASIPCISASMPEHQRVKYLPAGEVQRGKEDTMDCASRSPVNILETKFTYLLQNGLLTEDNEQFLRDNGYVVNERVVFSDAFIAITSGTTRSGNSLKAPCEAIRVHGLIPKPMLPLEKTMTFDEYHNPMRITQDMYDLGEEFKRRFKIKYARVYAENFKDVLHTDMPSVAGFAWTRPNEDGEYPPSDNQPNHAFMVFETPLSLIFDNYYDVVDGDFIKKLTENYRFYHYGYRIYIESQVSSPIRTTLLERLLDYIIRLWQKLHTSQYTTVGVLSRTL